MWEIVSNFVAFLEILNFKVHTSQGIVEATVNLCYFDFPNVINHNTVETLNINGRRWDKISSNHRKKSHLVLSLASVNRNINWK